jgi:hypothetical protein
MHRRGGVVTLLPPKAGLALPPKAGLVMFVCLLVCLFVCIDLRLTGLVM